MLEIPERIRPHLRRAYSVADADPGTGCVEFLVKTIGPGTAALERLLSGASARLLGPLGNPFSLADLPRGARVAVVAGGIGAAPFPLLYRSMTAAGVVGDFFLGAKAAADLTFRRRFSRLVTGQTHVATEDGSLGEKGLVTELFQKHAGDGLYTKVFACGPMAMFAPLATAVARLGLRAEFSTEAEMGCGFGACLGCAIPGTEKPFIISCQEGPVLSPTAIAWERLLP